MKRVTSTLHRGGEGQNARRANFSNTYGQGCRLFGHHRYSELHAPCEAIIRQLPELYIYNLDCNCSNVIYLTNCTKCKVQYVGSTTTRFRTRFNNHKSRVNAHVNF